MIRSAVWLVGWFIVCSVGWLVGRSVGWLVGWLRGLVGWQSFAFF